MDIKNLTLSFPLKNPSHSIYYIKLISIYFIIYYLSIINLLNLFNYPFHTTMHKHSLTCICVIYAHTHPYRYAHYPYAYLYIKATPTQICIIAHKYVHPGTEVSIVSHLHDSNHKDQGYFLSFVCLHTPHHKLCPISWGCRIHQLLLCRG